MEKKAIVIIGATSGIGRATALQCAKKGYMLALACRQEKELFDLATECQKTADKVIIVPTDISKEDEVRHLAQQAVDAFGGFDVWINDAAVGVYGRFEDIPSRHAHRLIDVNIMGYIYGSKAAIQHFKARRRGTLINVASVAGVIGQPFLSHYAMSKFAVRGLCISLQTELAFERDIHVCCVLPTVMDTPFFQHAANFTGLKLRAPGPAFDPNRVARMFLKLMRKPRPEVFVGTNPWAFSIVRAVFPHFFEKTYLKFILRNQFQQTAAPPSDGNIFNPMDDWSAQVSGGWRHN